MTYLSDDEIESMSWFADIFSSPLFWTIASFFGALIWGAILSLIVSAIMKKDAPLRI